MVGPSKQFGLGLILGLTLFACASFSYERWGWDYKNKKLLHYKTSNKDIPDSACDNEDGKFKCIMMFSSDYYQMKTDFEVMAMELDACQKSQGNTVKIK